MLTTEDRRRWIRACLVGGLLVLIPYTWMIMSGRFEPLAPKPLGDFYDAQAHALLDGHWHMPREVLKVESYEVEGRTYMYFGPMPAFARLPIAAVTDRFDGRLTQLSMTLGVTTAMVFGSRLHWRFRRRVRGDDVPLDRTEVVAAGIFTAAIGGSSLLFLAGTPIIYHEAITWGVALSLAAFEAVVAWWEHPTIRRLALATAAILAALLTRSSVGGGPLAALALLGAYRFVRAPRTWRTLVPLGVAVLLPVVVYAGINQAKFGSPFSVPFQTQGINEIRPDRADVLAANDGTIFGVRFLPSTALQYLRPDALDVDREFPYLDFPGLARVVGDVTFDDLEPASSVPTGMPLLTVLAAVGLVAMVRRPNLRVLLVPVAGALAGVVVTLTIGYIAQRYTADALPALVLTGSVGLHVVVARAHRWLVPALVGLAAVSVLLSATFALRYQREWGFLIPEDHRAELVRFQYDTAPLLGDRPQVGRGDELPPPEPAERFFVIGDCAATYWSKGETWEPVERMPEGGRFVFDLTLPAAFRGEAELVSTLDLVVEDDGEGGAQLRFRHGDDESPAYAFTPGEPMRLDVVVDRRLGYVNVRRDGRMLFEPFYDGPPIDPELGDDVPGEVELVPRQPSACRAVTGGRSS